MSLSSLQSMLLYQTKRTKLNWRESRKKMNNQDINLENIFLLLRGTVRRLSSTLPVRLYLFISIYVYNIVVYVDRYASTVLICSLVHGCHSIHSWEFNSPGNGHQTLSQHERDEEKKYTRLKTKNNDINALAVWYENNFSLNAAMKLKYLFHRRQKVEEKIWKRISSREKPLLLYLRTMDETTTLRQSSPSTDSPKKNSQFCLR